VRTFQFLRATEVSVLSGRRQQQPFGLAGGAPGARGQNLLNDAPLPGAVALKVMAGDRLTLLTPGGGGFGPPDAPRQRR
jgi:N-methylhydantoinase B/oxoprolinase/acetone carboxylase alpha subunit